MRCGFVAVLGAPNAGKSTLINQWVGSKVSIVSSKVQTTRTLVKGIALQDESQIIFIDTPGIFRPKERLEKAMVAAAWQGRAEADMIILVVDAGREKISGDTLAIIDRMQKEDTQKKAVLVLNKTDKSKKENLLSLSAKLNDMYDFTATFMISAIKEDGVKDVLTYLANEIPEGPWHYEDDEVSDMPMRLMAAEITREKCFHRLHQELPYGLAVETEQWEDFDDGSVKISQIIMVSRDSHKGIVLGKGGQSLGKIGEEARLELEEILECRVHLKIFVKVDERWRDNPEKYQIWGLDYSA